MIEFLRRWWWRLLGREIKIKRRRKPSRGAEVEDTGRWYFKRDILEQLDTYFMYLRKMRTTDRDAYNLYRQVGGILVSGKHKNWVGNMVHCDSSLSFGAIFRPMMDEKEEIEDDEEERARGEEEAFHPWFIYFQKYVRPPYNVEPFDGSVYSVVAVMGRHNPKDKWAMPAPCFVGVNLDGTVKVLREMTIKYQELPRHQKKLANVANLGSFGITHMKWGTPSWLRETARRNRDNPGILNRLAPGIDTSTIDGVGTFLFGWAYQSYLAASQDIRVRVMNDEGLVAAFSIDMLRTPYFFDGRDFVADRSGRRKKIFHIVRTHERNLKSGRTTYVRSHFRGVKSFVWEGYDVLVTMPGLHHQHLTEFDHGAIDGSLLSNLSPEVLSTEDFGRRLNAHLTKGYRGKIKRVALREDRDGFPPPTPPR